MVGHLGAMTAYREVGTSSLSFEEGRRISARGADREPIKSVFHPLQVRIGRIERPKNRQDTRTNVVLADDKTK